jgi:N-acetyl sugar amidotransferase
MTADLRWCTNCVAMSTRPRITFDERGWCNACRWAEQKRTLDWEARGRELESLLAKHRSDGVRFDCIVPVSGGKDGSYVAHTLKHRFGMHPLAVTVNPPLPLELGQRNLRAFAESGFDLVAVTPSHEAMRQLDRIGFEEMGFPYYGWLIAIHTAVIRVALSFGIHLLFYGEDGEVEYGGSTETSHAPVYGMDYQRRIYLEGGYEKVLERCDVPPSDLHFFTFPTEAEAAGSSLDITHWSYFEDWDPYRNYLVAKEHCGLEESTDSNAGTFTNFAQNDQALYALHTYLMYLKFGFGRANQDAAIEVRRGAMERSQAVNLVNLYDGQYPEPFLQDYLDHYRMTRDEFDAVLDRWANRELFEKVDGRWRPRFRVV